MHNQKFKKKLIYVNKVYIVLVQNFDNPQCGNVNSVI